MRHGQVTLFIIIGLVLLGTFVFINQVNTTLQTAQLEQQAQGALQEAINTNAMRFYAEGCLQEVTSRGLLLAGSQGGNIYAYQNGSHLALPTGPRKSKEIQCIPGKNMSECRGGYGIQEPTLLEGTNSPPPPHWPRFQQSPKLDFDTWGYFGEASITPICYLNGTNRFNASGDLRNPFCLGKTYGLQDSTQYVLQEYIERELPRCFNPENLTYAQQYNFTFGDPNVSVTYGEADTRATAMYPVTFSFAGRPPVTTFADFSVSLPVRFKRLGELASFISVYDSARLGFNASSDFRRFRTVWDSRMNISFSQPYRNQNIFDDLVTISDTGSSIAGQIYAFQFIRQNRHPALDLIRSDDAREPYDIIVLEGSTIEIRPNPDTTKIYDPDEDVLTYFYVGWKETYDSHFDRDTGQTVTRSGIPRNWTMSLDYRDTQREASYKTNRSDIGPHNLTVYVCDEYHNMSSTQVPLALRVNNPETVTDGDIPKFLNVYQSPLCDWQLVRILVADIPQLNITGYNDFSDINDSYASVEDFYTFNWAGTFAYFTSFDKVILKIPYEGQDGNPLEIIEDFDVDSTDTLHRIPETNTTILDIVSKVFQRTHEFLVNGVPIGDHNISFSTNVPGPSKILNVTVMDCLPHRGTDAPYPYNTTGTDPWASNHTCCLGGGPSPDTFDVIVDVSCNANNFENKFNNAASVSGATSYTVLTKTAAENNNCYVVYAAFNMNGERIVDDNWGTYASQTQTCYTDPNDKYGGMVQLLNALPAGSTANIRIANVPGIFSQTGLLNSLRTANALAKVNDVFKSTLVRKCSGTRGNTCTGEQELSWSVHDQCADPNTAVGEVLRCEGPRNPSATTATQTCTQYSAGDTWETSTDVNADAFVGLQGIDPSALEVETGKYACNPTLVCSSTPSGLGYSTIAPPASGRFVVAGGCSNGGCTAKLRAYDCQDNNTCTAESFDATKLTGYKVKKTSCSGTITTATLDNPSAKCAIDYNELRDLDANEFACKTICADYVDGLPSWGSTQMNCWGDDIWEGGPGTLREQSVTTRATGLYGPNKWVLVYASRFGSVPGCEGTYGENVLTGPNGPGGGVCCGDTPRSSQDVEDFKCEVPLNYVGYVGNPNPNGQKIYRARPQTGNIFDKNGNGFQPDGSQISDTTFKYRGGEWVCDDTDYSSEFDGDLSDANFFRTTGYQLPGSGSITYNTAFYSPLKPFCVSAGAQPATKQLIKFTRSGGTSTAATYRIRVDYSGYAGVDCESASGVSRFMVYSSTGTPLIGAEVWGEQQGTVTLSAGSSQLNMGFRTEAVPKQCIINSITVTKI